MKKLIYIAGLKGGGKSDLGIELAERFSNLEPYDSYVDREPRYPGEQGHCFISSGNFDMRIRDGRIDLHDTVMFEEYRVGLSYRELNGMIKEQKVPLIMTRTPGIIEGLRKRYPGSLGIWLQTDQLTAVDRLQFRGKKGNPLTDLFGAKISEMNLSGTRRYFDFTVVGDDLDGANLVDRPLMDIVADVEPVVSEYLKS